MVDVVVNHMAPAGSSLNYTNYKSLKPFNSSAYYHDPCLIDDNNSTSVVKCRVNDGYVSLPDIRTEDLNVRGVLQTWIQELVHKYGVDGIRIDTVKHVEKSFFPDFIQASGVFGLAEIFDGNPANYPVWSSYVPGALNYPASVTSLYILKSHMDFFFFWEALTSYRYYWLLRTFQSKTAWMDELVTGVNQMKSACLILILTWLNQSAYTQTTHLFPLSKTSSPLQMVRKGLILQD